MERHPNLSHNPSHGHLIHGPLTEIFVIRSDSQQLFSFPGKFLHLALKNKAFKCQVFCVNIPSDSFALGDILNEVLGTAFVTKVDSSEQNIYSTEFGACLIVIQFANLDTRMLRLLYNVYSRARSYCEIMVIVDDQYSADDLEEFLNIFKDAKIRNI